MLGPTLLGVSVDFNGRNLDPSPILWQEIGEVHLKLDSGFKRRGNHLKLEYSIYLQCKLGMRVFKAWVTLLTSNFLLVKILFNSNLGPVPLLHC